MVSEQGRIRLNTLHTLTRMGIPRTSPRCRHSPHSGLGCVMTCRGDSLQERSPSTSHTMDGPMYSPATALEGSSRTRHGCVVKVSGLRMPNWKLSKGQGSWAAHRKAVHAVRLACHLLPSCYQISNLVSIFSGYYTMTGVGRILTLRCFVSRFQLAIQLFFPVKFYPIIPNSCFGRVYKLNDTIRCGVVLGRLQFL